jgi:hypothetical protein
MEGFVLFLTGGSRKYYVRDINQVVDILRSLGRQKCEQGFHFCDADGDGNIDKKEFCLLIKFTCKYQHYHQVPAATSPRAILAVLQPHVVLAAHSVAAICCNHLKCCALQDDTVDGGHLGSEPEFEAAFLEVLFRSIDADGDGGISLSEWLEWAQVVVHDGSDYDGDQPPWSPSEYDQVAAARSRELLASGTIQRTPF